MQRTTWGIKGSFGLKFMNGKKIDVNINDIIKNLKEIIKSFDQFKEILNLNLF